MDDVLSKMSDQASPKLPMMTKAKNGFSRTDVVDAFVSAFEMIGGVPRLALWANANPDKFYPLYAKLLPATTQVIGDMGELVIIHRIAPTALDVHEVVVIENQVTKEEPCPPSISDTSPVATSPRFTLVTSDGVSLSPTDEQERPLPPSTT